MNQINLEEIRDVLYKRLSGTGWDLLLRTYILDSEFIKLLQTLLTEANDGKRFVPQVKYLFGAFEKCPLKDLKVVLMGQSPYPYVGVPNGSAFCCELDGRVQASLQYIFKNIQKTVYNDGFYEWNPNLSHWSKQGVLLLNAALTTTVGSSESHIRLWKPFITFLFDMLTKKHPGLVYGFLGNHAQAYQSYVPIDQNDILRATHPASAAYNQAEEWVSHDIFNKINQKLKERGLTPVVW